jgi:hypothetical protein
MDSARRLGSVAGAANLLALPPPSQYPTSSEPTTRIVSRNLAGAGSRKPLKRWRGSESLRRRATSPEPPAQIPYALPTSRPESEAPRLAHEPRKRHIVAMPHRKRRQQKPRFLDREVIAKAEARFAKADKQRARIKANPKGEVTREQGRVTRIKKQKAARARTKR